MRSLIHMLEEAIERLNSRNKEYIYVITDIASPLPEYDGKEHYEVVIYRTDKEGGNRQRIASKHYSFPKKRPGEAKERACEFIVSDLITGALYHYQPKPTL